MADKSKKIFVYSGLSASHAWIQSMAEKWGLEMVLVEDGSTVFEKVSAELPNFVVLDVSMPNQSGIECSREIKDFSSWVKVILISTVHSLSIQDAAKKARADLFVVDSVASVKVPEFVETMLQRKELPPDVSEKIEREVLSRRGAPRFPFEGEVQFLLNEHWFSGIFVNVSLDGLLFQTKDPIEVGQKLTLSWMDDGKKHVEVLGIVVRQISSDHPQYPYLIGIQFFETPASLDKTITEYSEEIDGFEQTAGIEMDLDLIREVLTKGNDYFRNLFQGNKAPLFIEVTITDIVEHERNSFQNTDEYSLCIQDLVSSKIICQLIESSAEQLKAVDYSMSQYVGQLVFMTNKLLEKIEKIEAKSDEFVKKSMHENRPSERHQLNESNNRLYQAKASMLKAVSSKIKRSNIPEDYQEQFNEIVQKNKQLTSYQEHMDEILKKETEQLKTTRVASRAAPRITKFVKKLHETFTSPERGIFSSQKGGKQNLMLPVFAGLFLLGAVYPWMGSQMKAHFANPHLPLFIKPNSITQTSKDAMEIDLSKASWDILGHKGHNLVLDQIEVFLTRKGLHQCKILDGDLLIAAVYGASNENRRAYLRRIFFEAPVNPGEISKKQKIYSSGSSE